MAAPNMMLPILTLAWIAAMGGGAIFALAGPGARRQRQRKRRVARVVTRHRARAGTIADLREMRLSATLFSLGAMAPALR